MTQTNLQFAGSLYAGYDLKYDYAENSQQISNIAENSYRTEGTGVNTPTTKTSEYSYDANGNLIYTATGTVKDDKLQATNTRKLLWDEENRLLGISDNGFVSQYWYDASGERTVKESFDNEGVYINGALSGARTGTSKFTAYISPYMVVSQGGNYTKHVYMGSQRITSKVSNSGIFSTSPVNATDLQAKLSQQTTKIKERFDSLGVQYSGLQQTGGLVSASPATTADSYFYHPDHLGSSSLITSGSGDLVQHIQYIPFGEVFVEERNATWSTPYKFNGKELDDETGLYYYGARYYDPRTSVWLSVDPLTEKFPNVGSYVYCDNNPIIYIDPDGRIKWPINKNGNGAGWNTTYGWFGEARKTHTHAGVDINKNTGGSTDLDLPVYSTHTGSVVSVKPYNKHKNSSGTVVIIQSSDKSLQTVYMHLNSALVNEGDEITEGQQIGTVGGSGYGSLRGHMVHLHYEIRKLINGIYEAINPESSRGEMIDAQELIYGGSSNNVEKKTGLNIYSGPTYLNRMPEKSFFKKILSIFIKPQEPSPEFYQRLENERNNRKN